MPQWISISNANSVQALEKPIRRQLKWWTQVWDVKICKLDISSWKRLVNLVRTFIDRPLKHSRVQSFYIEAIKRRRWTTWSEINYFLRIETGIWVAHTDHCYNIKSLTSTSLRARASSFNEISIDKHVRSSIFTAFWCDSQGEPP